MDSQDSFMDDRMNLAQIWARKSVDVVYNQTPIQPLQESYQAGQNIRLVFQRSKSVINLADVQVLFRPVICWSDKDALPDIARKSFLGITPTHHNGADFFQCTSITFNNNQILAQTGIAQTTPRNLFMNYFHSLSSKKKTDFGTEEYIAGICTSLQGGQLSQVVGTEEILPATHPYSLTGVTISTKTEFDAWPRAILSKAYTYNMEHNLPPQNGLTLTANAYLSGTMDAVASASSSYYFGGIPMPAGDGSVAGQSGDVNVAYSSNFPLLPLMISSSIAIYKGQQERFQRTRMRFLTATTSVYPYCAFYDDPIQTNSIKPIGQPLSTTYAKTSIMNNSAVATQGPQRSCYATSVQGPYGCYQTASQNGVQRYGGQQWTAQDGTYFPKEQYTNMSCSLGQLSIELAQIQNVCMDSTQVVVLLQPSNPNQVLSAYLQTGLFKATNTVKPAPNGPTEDWNTGASSDECQQFLNACLIGSATYKLCDVICRIPYQLYPSESYPIVRNLLYQPVSFQSIRIQVDPIMSLTSSFSQRIAVGGSALINGTISFVLANSRILSNASKPLRVQDTVLNYQTLQPPCLGDLRFVAGFDSLFLPYSQWSVFLDSQVYESSPLIAISNPQYSSYLKSQDAWFQIFGKHFNADLRSFLHNRSCVAVAINPYNDRSKLCVDSQLVLTCQFDGTDRIELSKTLGLQTTSYEPGSFSLYTVVVCSQSLVNDDYVKI